MMEKINSGSVSRHLLPPLGLLIFLLLFLGFFQFWYQHKKTLAEKIASQGNFLHNYLQDELKEEFKLLSAAVLPIAADESVQRALSEKNDRELLRLGQTRFEALKLSHGLTHFHYFDPQRISLLRLHKPELNGDLIDRFTAIMAERTKQLATGLEIGLLGTLTLRAVQPVFYRDELVGYLELGKDIGSLLSEAPVPGVEKMVLVRKKYLQRSYWEDGMKLLNQPFNWEAFADFVLVYSSSSLLSEPADAEILSALSEFKDKDNEFSRVGRLYSASSIALYDISAREIGRLILICDISADREEFLLLMRKGGLVCTLILLSMMIIIFMLLRRTEGFIESQSLSLQQSEEKYRTLFTEMIDGFALHEIICNEEGKVVDYRFLAVNPAFERMTGLKAEEIIGKTVLAVLPGTEESWIQKYGQVALSGEEIHFENFSQEIGKYFEVKAFCPEKGRFACIFVDITERKLAEEALKNSHERLEMVMNSMDAVVYIADMQNHEVLFVNNYARMQVGDVLGRKCWEVFQNQSGPCDFCTNKKLLDKNREPSGVYRWNFKNEKENRWYDCHDRAIRWADGRLVRMEMAFDITELKNLQEQFLQAQKMESIGRLAGGIAHDFNNMLSVISGYTEMAITEHGHGSVALLKKLHEIKNAARHSANLTSQLLAFARKQTIAPRVLDVNSVIGGMLKMLQRLIGEDISLLWFPGDDLWAVLMDPVQLEQMLANLCVNARDAINADGRITIETGKASLSEDYCALHLEMLPGEYVFLSVSDNGCGMTEEQKSKIFEPFFTTKKMGEGTGLGLPTVHGIVRQNNGFVNVYSEPENGAVFKIYLPAHKLPESETKKPVAPVVTELVQKPLSGNETVMLVEDAKAIRDMTVLMLDSMGYRVLACSDPEDALKKAESCEYDIHLLITDVIMPGMNCREFTQKMKVFYPQIKTLFMSGYTANVIAHHGVLDDGINFLQKPFSRAELGDKIKEALNNSQI